MSFELTSSKLPNVGTTIFTTMSQLAAETGAINLSQGFPNFSPPAGLLDAIEGHLRHGNNQYAPMTGVPELREAIAAKVLRLQRRVIDPETQVTVCSGATEGLFSAIQAVVKPGDEVIVLDPAYDSYEPSITLAGGVTRHVALRLDNQSSEFSIDWDRLASTINAKTRLIVLNFPHNPTGTILHADDLDHLADLIRDTNCLLLSDEVYEHIVFEGESHVSLMRHDELWPRSLIISSFGKTFHATGWKIGYCLAPPQLSEEFRKVHQFVTFTVNTPVQHGIADFMTAEPEFADRLADFYQSKRDYFCGLLSESRFSFTPAASTFFQILDYSTISEDLDARIAAQWTREHGVASIPLTVFCEQPFTGSRLRFCFAKDDATLEAAAAKLSQL